MNKEKDFFKTCFDTVAGLEVKNESQAIAKEVVLSEIGNLQEENEELKSQLRGTTHCFDEEEHNKLKEENTNLSKDVDMWNAKYNDMFDENRMLKEALETKSYCKYANKCDELDDCSREEYEDMANANVRLSVENYDLKEENQELKKQLKPNYYVKGLEGTLKEYQQEMNKVAIQQKEFIKYLEDGIKRINPKELDIGELNLRLDDIKFTQYLIYKEILQKYKSIIGVSDEKEN